jgi:hypothetical protein
MAPIRQLPMVSRIYIDPRRTLMNDHGLFLITSRLCATGNRSIVVWVIR